MIERRAYAGRSMAGGGSAWESNPASPRERGATDFEDREGHRAPFASTELSIVVVLRLACGSRARSGQGDLVTDLNSEGLP